MSQLSRRISSGAILTWAGLLSWSSVAAAQRAARPAAPAGAAPSATAPSATALSAVPVATEFDRLHFRSIGPATMSGRIADVAVFEANPAIYYVGTAHGGVWKTVNNGTTFTPQFQNEGLIAIGDVAVSQTNPDVVWVGAGESNNRQSTSWGDGIYKSTDGGTSWKKMGLGASRHINRVLIHPSNENIVFVAATGPLFGAGGDRGVYRTTDGGATWTQVLKGDEDTGANDIVMSATDPNIMFASMYQRRRTTCCMNGGGPGSALYKSTDGGSTWNKVTGTGFPTGPLGRIAVDVFRSSANIVYAMVEGPTGTARPAAGEEMSEAPAGPGAQNAAPATGIYRSTDGGATWTKMSSTNPRPMYFSQLRVDPVNPDRLMLGGVGLHLSVDGGRTFETDAALVTHDDVHAVWINPRNPDHVLIGNDGGLAVSYDLARTWQFIPNLPVGLFYHVGFDMELPYNICGGMQDNYDWCGPSASRHSRGIFNYDWFQILGGDGFVAVPDLRDSRIVYTESQDGNLIRRNKVTGESRQIRPNAQNVVNATRGESYRFHWDTPLMLSPNDPGVLLVAANRVFRSRDRGDSWEAISPDLTTNKSRDTLTTMGLKGRDIRIARNDGISQWPAIVTLAESPKQAGVFYTGTDDGNVSVSRDDGKTWTNITKNLPGFPSGDVYVSEVVASRFDAATVYVVVGNYRENDYKPYVWMSRDYGATFTSLAGTLGGETVRTLTEDTKNADVLYIGTETGIFLTLDRGKTWKRLKANFPTVRVDELTIHPRDNALLVATHGRALWVLDHLEPIQEYAAAQKKSASLFSPGMALQWKSKDDRNEEFWGHQFFTGENPPTDAVIQMHFTQAVKNPMLRISTAQGTLVRELAIPTAKNAAGIQTVCWDQRVEPVRVTAVPLGGPGGPGGGQGGGPGGGFGQGTSPRRTIPGYPVGLPPVGYEAANPCAGGGPGGGGFGGFGGNMNNGPLVVPGTYTVALVVDGQVVEQKPLTIVMDPQVQLTADQRVAYNAAAMELHTAQQQAQTVVAPLTALMSPVRTAKAKLDSLASAPDSVKTQFAAFQRDYDALRAKFGVGAPAVGGFGGGGGGGGAAAAAAAQANALARVGAVKNNMLAVFEAPSAALLSQAKEAQDALSAAVTEANAFMARAASMKAMLAPLGITLP